MRTGKRDQGRPQILVVDDSPNELKALVIGLKLEGFDVVGVADGNSALNKLNQNDYAIVLIDLMMPQMNGLQLAREIRKAHPGVKTMLMSAYTLSPVQLAKVDVGVIGFVPKPYSFSELVRFIQDKIDWRADVNKTVEALPATDDALHTPMDLASILAV